MSIIEILEKKTEALDANDLALLLKLSPREVYKLVRKGVIPAMRIGVTVRLDPGDVVRWLRSIRTKQSPLQSELNDTEPKKDSGDSSLDPDADGFAL